MSIRYQADSNLNQLIVAATYRREPGIDFQTASKAHLSNLDDLTVLQRGASEGRILVTHDKRTMPVHFASFLKDGNSSPGALLVIPQDAPLRSVVETLVLIWADDTPEDWKNTITIVPFQPRSSPASYAARCAEWSSPRLPLKDSQSRRCWRNGRAG